MAAISGLLLDIFNHESNYAPSPIRIIQFGGQEAKLWPKQKHGFLKKKL